jgi:O-antigen ligase
LFPGSYGWTENAIPYCEGQDHVEDGSQIHGAAFTALSYSVIKGEDLIPAPVLLGLLFLCSVATAVAGIVMWFWKRWGIYLYVIAGLTTAVLFLMRTGSIWMFFGALLPMVIVGYILQPRLKYFS